MPTEDAQLERREGRPRYLVHEFFVDFLGGLVPGILFVVATSFAIVPPLWASLRAISNERPTQSLSDFVSQLLAATQNTPNMLWIASFIFVLIFSYILGHIFYRRDPKIPDVRSFKRISQNLPSETELKLLYHGSPDEWRRKSFACITEDDCQFPYAYLHDYLETRGHKHLVRLLTWQEDTGRPLDVFG